MDNGNAGEGRTKAKDKRRALLCIAYCIILATSLFISITCDKPRGDLVLVCTCGRAFGADVPAA